MIKVGLVGYGLAGSVFHAPLIASVPELELASVVTRREAPRLPTVASVDELLRDVSIDLVVIASPSALHFAHAKAAMLAGKHVVVDKPLATTSQEAEELIALALKQKRILTVFQNRRWDGDFLTVKRILPSLGKVYFFEAHFDRFRPQIKNGWREVPGAGAGILYDLGAHLIDQALCLFGVPLAVTADVLSQRPEAHVDDYFHLVLDYGARRAILHASTLAAAPGYHFIVHGDAGSFLKSGMDSQEDALKRGVRPGDPSWGLDPPQNYGEFTGGSGERRQIITERGCYEHFYSSLVECIRHGAPAPVDPRESRDGLRMIEAALLSAHEHRTVYL